MTADRAPVEVVPDAELERQASAPVDGLALWAQDMSRGLVPAPLIHAHLVQHRTLAAELLRCREALAKASDELAVARDLMADLYAIESNRGDSDQADEFEEYVGRFDAAASAASALLPRDAKEAT